MTAIAKLACSLLTAGVIGAVPFGVNLSSRVSVVEATHAAEQPAIDRRFESVEKRLEALDGKTDKVLQGLGRIEGQLSHRPR